MTSETEILTSRNSGFLRISRLVETNRIRQLAITASSTDLVATMDVDGFLVTLNSAGYQLLGLNEQEDPTNLRLIDFYSKESASAFVKDGISTAFTSGACHSEVTIVSRSGTTIPSSQVLIAHKDDVGNIEYFSVILHDIRSIREAEKERKTLIDQLHQSRKMETVGRLAGGIAHDFNNYMTVIMGHAELGLLNVGSELQTRAQLDTILECAKKAAGLSNQLLDFSSKQIVKPQTLNLNEVLLQSQKLIESLMGEEINILIHANDTLWPIYIDRSQLDQAILNLAINSRDAMNHCGIFCLKSENTVLSEKIAHGLGIADGGDYVKLSVQDDGRGIKPEHIEQIFDPFFTTKGKGKGTGLGLSAVYGALKQNESYITVASTEGAGTCFELYFPRDTISRHLEQVESGENDNLDPILGKEMVLLVEDDESVRSLLSTVLKNLGYTVFEANNGLQGLEIFTEHQDDIELVISDVIMPKMNGMELYRKLRKFDKPVKILLMSGHTEQALSLKELSEGGAILLNKPFPIKKFAETVREVLTD